MKKLFKFYLIIGMVQVMALLFSFCHGQNGNGEKFTWKTFSPDGHMYIGVDYYPEHWPRERWEIDIKLMKEAGFNVVRLAEFAWVLMEPSEGNFDFQWLDDVISILEKYDIKVILGTPTAVMPAWLARKYPETLAVSEEGNRVVWGGRKNNCFSSGTYRLLSERITQEMAQHFANTANVIGWQTDNEFAGPVCFCEKCLDHFQDWLGQKYSTLDTLNRAWGTHFWGHKLQAWGEITIPDCTGEGPWGVSGNPGACLDWFKFNSWLNVTFQSEQVRIIRSINPDHFVTHNLMSFHPEVSYYDLGKDLDFVSWDNYPVWNKPDIPYGASMAADLMRGVKGQNFWIMEQTAGATGWGSFYRNPRPGEIRKISYQQLAHGADAQIWFRWRTSTAGREQYWHGLLGHDGKPMRRYHEAAQVAREYRSLEKILIGTTVKSEVAIIYDYNSIWSLQGQPGFDGNNYVEAIKRYYDAFFRAGINVDLISPEADISRYKLVLTPDLIVLPDPMAEKLTNYVSNGGVLLADCRTGVKDESNLVHERTLPGKLAPVLGIEITEYGAVTPDMEYKVDCGSNGLRTAVKYVDWVTPKGAEVKAIYDQWHLKSFAAVTRNSFGAGKGWYVGTIIKESEFYDGLISDLLLDAGIEKMLNLPLGVEASFREGNGTKLMFLINHTEEVQTIRVPEGKKELLSNKKTQDTLELGIFEVAIIEM